MSLDTVLTEDGSLTCLDSASGELYHNRAGAYSEALYHYVQVCDLVEQANRQGKLNVLDICFGLGYNTFVLIEKLIEHIENGDINRNHICCSIIGIDNDPEIFSVLSQILKDSRFKRLRLALNLQEDSPEKIFTDWQSGAEYLIEMKNKVQLTVQIEIKVDNLREVVPKLVTDNYCFDYIFHDGFSPRSMPELWTLNLFAQYVRLLNADGRIITYSAATAVRGALMQCRLEIRKSAPLGRKSGGTIAFRSHLAEIADGQNILFLDEEEKHRLDSRSSTPYRDLTFKDTRAEILQRRAAEIKQSDLPSIKE